MVLNYITWNVNPVAFSLGPLTVRWYGICWAVGFLLGYLLMSKVYKKEKMPAGEIDSLLIYMLVFTVIGARLGHCLFYEPKAYLSDPISILKIWEGGLASHGGAIGILLGLWIYVRRFNKKALKKTSRDKNEKTHITYLWILDRIVIPVCLVGALIRLGNVFNSEIYGKPTTLPWGFVFVQGEQKFFGDNGELLPCHPTGLYEAFFCLVAMALLLWMFFKRNIGDKRPGMMFGTFLVIIFGSRIAIEFLKNVQVEFEKNMTLDMGQWLSVPFVIVGIVMIVWSLRAKRE
ncbi:MAG: prolipoprotein diacylglyceryl transferase [Bacteroidales bacterium]|nr:prolipoprotein diacylglyceryl transferase [Bacteroidales bacterium]